MFSVEQFCNLSVEIEAMLALSGLTEMWTGSGSL